MFRSKAMHHDRKTLEFEADSESNNVTLNNREHFALKIWDQESKRQLVQLETARLEHARWNATKSVANALTTVGMNRTVAGPFFPSLFANFCTMLLIKLFSFVIG